MIVGIENGVVITILDNFEHPDSHSLPRGITAEYAPDWVFVGCTFENRVFSAPHQDGWAFDVENARWYPHEEYRRILHERTTNDTMQAYRKLRQGDKTIDWQAWLDELDAYNVAIEETQNQPDYPNKVEYPEYPAKPTPQS